MRQRFAVLMLLTVIAVLFVGALPTFAGESSEADVAIDGCQVVVGFYMPGSITASQGISNPLAKRYRGPATNTVNVEMWDDGTLLNTQSVTAGVEEYVTVYFPITQLYVAEDVGIYVIDPLTSYQYYANDPVIILDSVAEPCLEQIVTTVNCPYPPQPLLGQGRVIGPVMTYFAPSLSAETNPSVVLPVGTSWWILEARDGFYKLFIACQGRYVWVTAESLGANFDVVWNGRSLPDAGERQN